ncbi:putative bifunctional diguanylate cyclase/phosphodiesterase [Pseudoduganella namucuonensis]|uniref:Diguanylate cyclase/phosphodiesterase n=1 Tax=Pseudoduganella namucuonensis TaxID=1035707 RepID=A0A1I7HA74_9BURK|nr:EAL domain-containing protein [Pseudoduganella namucuonensis]SFU57588.1 diguanylate cyclase/phosphodiesterase [Pseudoduganella namucuonensis]
MRFNRRFSFHFRSLESRIVTLFLLLIVLVQVVGLLVIQRGIESNARAAIAMELNNGGKVFRRLLEQNAQSLRFGARLLARDTAFVAAIGNNEEADRATIESALANHGRRIKASASMLVSAERKITATTSEPQSAGLSALVLGMLDQAEASDGANGIGVVDRYPYQVVVMPVKAPIVIGWIVMTFPIDRQLAEEMRDVSALQTTIATRDKAGSWLPVASTLGAPLAGGLMRQMEARPPASPADGAFEAEIGDTRYSARRQLIGEDAGQNVSVVLARSIDEAIAEYARLERWLLGLTIAGILISAAVSIVTAKRIAQPLSQLAGVARRLERGDYKGQIEFKREDEIGALAHAFDSMRDGIAKREQEIRRLAYWDTLTNLPNRAQFLLHLNDSIAESRKREASVFVLMMDLDRFKHVNDVMGHSFGDALLRQVAARLQLRLAERRHTSAQVARLGGDEFAVLLPDADLEQAQLIAQELLDALETPLSLEDQMVDIGAGMGIAGYPMHGEDGEQLLGMAEVAMYTAKQRSAGAVVYHAAFDKASEQSLSLLTELRNAVERNEFRLFVQPKIMLGTGKAVGAEALVRWAHPERGNVFPDQFIPFAEQTGFIRVLTRWVMEQSAILAHELAARGLNLKISVNLSTRDLMDQDLPVKFADILARHQLGPSAFCLEITESAIMDDPVRAQQTLERLHEMGLDLSIDDFGTGYSSLAYLKRLPVNELKIDKSFVLNMENDIGDTKIVRSTIDLGHNMGLRVVAEGIESEAVWRLLMRMGCDQGQGYFMSRPIPADQLAAWLENWRPPIAMPGDAAVEPYPAPAPAARGAAHAE